jgi:hypothetical protein
VAGRRLVAFHCVRADCAANFGGGGFDGGGEDALDADAVAAHDGGGLFAVAVEDGGAHGFGVLVAELEDVADLDGFADAQGLAADGVGLALVDVADVGDEGGLEVAHGVTLRRWYSSLLAPAMRLVRPSRAASRMTSVPGFFGCGAAVEADGAEVSGGCVEGGGDLFGLHGAEFAAGDGGELGLVELVVAAQEDDDGASLADGLDLLGRLRRDARRCRPWS